jgi:hypothetical protein
MYSFTLDTKLHWISVITDSVTVILQVVMYSIKQEPTGDSETCLTSCASEYEMVSIKEEKTSVVTEDPVEKTEREVNSSVSLCVPFKSFYRIVLDCIISTASVVRFLLPQTNRILVPPLVSGVFVHNCLNFAPFFLGGAAEPLEK